MAKKRIVERKTDASGSAKKVTRFDNSGEIKKTKVITKASASNIQSKKKEYVDKSATEKKHADVTKRYIDGQVSAKTFKEVKASTYKAKPGEERFREKLNKVKTSEGNTKKVERKGATTDAVYKSKSVTKTDKDTRASVASKKQEVNRSFSESERVRKEATKKQYGLVQRTDSNNKSKPKAKKRK
jgi:hypothetical protein